MDITRQVVKKDKVKKMLKSKNSESEENLSGGTTCKEDYEKIKGPLEVQHSRLKKLSPIITESSFIINSLLIFSDFIKENGNKSVTFGSCAKFFNKNFLIIVKNGNNGITMKEEKNSAFTTFSDILKLYVASLKNINDIIPSAGEEKVNSFLNDVTSPLPRNLTISSQTPNKCSILKSYIWEILPMINDLPKELKNTTFFESYISLFKEVNENTSNKECVDILNEILQTNKFNKIIDSQNNTLFKIVSKQDVFGSIIEMEFEKEKPIMSKLSYSYIVENFKISMNVIMVAWMNRQGGGSISSGMTVENIIKFLNSIGEGSSSQLSLTPTSPSISPGKITNVNSSTNKCSIIKSYINEILPTLAKVKPELLDTVYIKSYTSFFKAVDMGSGAKECRDIITEILQNNKFNEIINSKDNEFVYIDLDRNEFIGAVRGIEIERKGFLFNKKVSEGYSDIVDKFKESIKEINIAIEKGIKLEDIKTVLNSIGGSSTPQAELISLQPLRASPPPSHLSYDQPSTPRPMNSSQLSTSLSSNHPSLYTVRDQYPQQFLEPFDEYIKITRENVPIQEYGYFNSMDSMFYWLDSVILYNKKSNSDHIYYISPRFTGKEAENEVVYKFTDPDDRQKKIRETEENIRIFMNKNIDAYKNYKNLTR